MSDGKVPEWAQGENIKTFIARLEQHPEKGCIVVVRLTNKRGIPLELQLEPSADMAPPLQPGDSYELVGQSDRPEYVFQIDIEEAGLRVWVEGSGEGQAFHNGISVAY